jgi:beta-lactam-binding protein with PASTA domain
MTVNEQANGGPAEVRAMKERQNERALRRVGFYASAVAAAFFAAFLLVNYIVMPLLVRRGDLVQAPDLVGRSLVEARSVAKAAGLGVRIETERPDPDVQAGNVLEQIPEAGTDIKCGRTVAVVVSTGLDLRTVPRLAGMPARQAQIDAESAGFSVYEIVEVHTPGVERGDVVGSDPDAGAVLPAGTGIRLMVSLGPRPLELVMPSLIGKTPEEARLIAEGLGLVVRSTKYERGRNRSTALRDVVIVQEPPAGARVSEGDGVTLRIGKG